MMGEEVGDGVIFDFTMSATFGGIAIAELQKLSHCWPWCMRWLLEEGLLEPFIVEGPTMAPVPAPKL